MRRVKSWLCLLMMICGALTAAQKAEAITITYEATNLSGDLWQYTYTVSDYIFSKYEGFQIFFDYNLYSDIEEYPLLVAPNGDWDVYSWNSYTVFDMGDFYDGGYSAQALINNASLSDSFTVSFTWLGSGTPGAQAVQLFYDDGDFDNFSTRDIGVTVSTIPEPSTWALLTFGLLGLAGIKHRRNIQS